VNSLTMIKAFRRCGFYYSCYEAVKTSIISLTNHDMVFFA